MKTRGVRLAAVFAVVAALGAAAACNSDSTLPTEVAGTYQLTALNGKAVPTLFVTLGSSRYELRDGSLQMTTGGTFTMVLQYDSIGPRASTPAPADEDTSHLSATTSGDVSGSAGSLTFTARFENSFTGSVSGNTATITRQSGSTTFVYTFVRPSTAMAPERRPVLAWAPAVRRYRGAGVRG